MSINNTKYNTFITVPGTWLWLPSNWITLYLTTTYWVLLPSILVLSSYILLPHHLPKCNIRYLTFPCSWVCAFAISKTTYWIFLPAGDFYYWAILALLSIFNLNVPPWWGSSWISKEKFNILFLSSNNILFKPLKLGVISFNRCVSSGRPS